jgi:hypothetical protein
MKRVSVPEFEDLAWFPGWLRTCMTNNIVIMARLIGASHAVAELLENVMKSRGLTQIVDLGSGAGGVLPEMLPTLAARVDGEVSLLLSDKFPNGDAVKKFNEAGSGPVRYVETSVDATDLAAAPEGIKTMVNCFHHFEPTDARAILASAVEHRQPILIYEMAGHQAVPFALWLLTLPIGLTIVFLMAFLKSALVRPVTFNQLFFTYAIPIIPLFYAWDGQASMPRLYRLEDLDELLSGLERPGYSWEKGYGRSKSGGKLGSYLIGLPVEEGEGAR